MRVLIAPDKFKDALTASEACAAIAEGLRATHADWTPDLCPLTDGGEGFARILTDAVGGECLERVVAGPRGASVRAGFGLVSVDKLPEAVRSKLAVLPSEGRVAVVEMASASGLALLAPAERDVWFADTTGTGELIAAAMDCGACAILLGVGGSATNDLGLGALTALGARSLDEAGREASGCAPARWPGNARVVLDGLRASPPLWIACDVVNPLLGPSGAAATYGPQKGLDAHALPRLEEEVARMAALLVSPAELRRFAETPGAGVAGGIAFGLMAALGARLLPGFDLVADWLSLRERIDAADLVITGEGRFDASSLQGKGAGTLALMATARGKPVKLFPGRADEAALPGLEVYEISPRDAVLAESLAKAADHLRARVASALA